MVTRRPMLSRFGSSLDHSAGLVMILAKRSVRPCFCSHPQRSAVARVNKAHLEDSGDVDYV